MRGTERHASDPWKSAEVIKHFCVKDFIQYLDSPEEWRSTGGDSSGLHHQRRRAGSQLESLNALLPPVVSVSLLFLVVSFWCLLFFLVTSFVMCVISCFMLSLIVISCFSLPPFVLSPPPATTLMCFTFVLLTFPLVFPSSQPSQCSQPCHVFFFFCLCVFWTLFVSFGLNPFGFVCSWWTHYMVLTLSVSVNLLKQNQLYLWCLVPGPNLSIPSVSGTNMLKKTTTLPIACSPPPHPALPSSLSVSVGRQTTAPASVSAVAGTTAGIVEQGKVTHHHLLSCPDNSSLEIYTSFPLSEND